MSDNYEYDSSSGDSEMDRKAEEATRIAEEAEREAARKREVAKKIAENATKKKSLKFKSKSRKRKRSQLAKRKVGTLKDVADAIEIAVKERFETLQNSVDELRGMMMNMQKEVVDLTKVDAKAKVAPPTPSKSVVPYHLKDSHSKVVTLMKSWNVNQSRVIRNAGQEARSRCEESGCDLCKVYHSLIKKGSTAYKNSKTQFPDDKTKEGYLIKLKRGHLKKSFLEIGRKMMKECKSGTQPILDYMFLLPYVSKLPLSDRFSDEMVQEIWKEVCDKRRRKVGVFEVSITPPFYSALTANYISDKLREDIEKTPFAFGADDSILTEEPVSMDFAAGPSNGGCSEDDDYDKDEDDDYDKDVDDDYDKDVDTAVVGGGSSSGASVDPNQDVAGKPPKKHKPLSSSTYNTRSLTNKDT